MAEKTPFSVSVAKPNEKCNNLKSEITVKQFLDLLKTAYQVHDNIEGILVSKGMTDVAEWIKVKNCDQSIKETDNPPNSNENFVKEMICSDSEAKIAEVETKMQEKLNDMISEGIMDSVLPLMVPQNCPSNLKRSSSSKSSLDKLQICSTTKKKSSSTVKPIKTESEVEIHVCDEVMGTKRDFLCNQQLLIEKMGYFAEVSRDQKLDDMEISVHCDIGIFEWLMRWVKQDQSGDQPQLEVVNAIPILISATFLQMEPLIFDCLQFCHKFINEILKTSSSLSCLNDTILSRLAAMYTNTEVESIKDKKDKIQSRLYCKLIQSLCEIEPETLRGHFCTFARIYRCKFCQQLINPLYGSRIPCVASRMRLQFDGSIINNHLRDPNWDLNEYVLSLYKLTKSWRKVYWRLWGSCHFLFCNTCKKFFPAKQESWCRYHPDLPQFFTLDTQKPPLPVGRYPCCGERAYRFQILDDRSGCQFREHTFSPSADPKDTSIASILESMKHFIVEEPPKLVFPDRLTRLIAREPTDPDDSKLESKEVFWWEGIEIIPPRPKMGLLSTLESSPVQQEEVDDSPLDSSDDEDDATTSTNSTCSNASVDSEESMNICDKTSKKMKRKPRKRTCTTLRSSNVKTWQTNLSTRSNQDLQRLNEENAFKKIGLMLNDRTKLSSEIESHRMKTNSWRPGGIWVRLESEWKEKNVPNLNQKNRNIYNGRIRMKTKTVL